MKYTFREATQDDDEELTRFYNQMQREKTGRSLLLRRSFFDVESLGADSCRVTALFGEDQKVYGIGSCVVRGNFSQTTQGKIGYLSSLFLDKSVRNKTYFKEGFQHMKGMVQESHCDFWMTSIMAENDKFERVLTRPRPGMPQYRKISEYKTYIFVGDFVCSSNYTFESEKIILSDVLYHKVSIFCGGNLVCVWVILEKENFQDQFYCLGRTRLLQKGILRKRIKIMYGARPEFLTENKEVQAFCLRFIRSYVLAQGAYVFVVGLPEDDELANLFNEKARKVLRSNLYQVHWGDEKPQDVSDFNVSFL